MRLASGVITQSKLIVANRRLHSGLRRIVSAIRPSFPRRDFRFVIFGYLRFRLWRRRILVACRSHVECPRRKACLAYFHELQAGSDLRFIAGQFLGFGPNTSLDAAVRIFAVTDRRPGLIAAD